jgi:hypothetical protein
MVLAERTMLIERSSNEAASAEAPIWYLHGLGLVAQTDGTNTEYLMTPRLGAADGWRIGERAVGPDV